MAICAVALQNSPQKVRPLLQSFLLFFELCFSNDSVIPANLCLIYFDLFKV